MQKEIKEVYNFLKDKFKFIFLLLAGIFPVMLRSSRFGLPYKLTILWQLENMSIPEFIGIVPLHGWEVVNLRITNYVIFDLIYSLFGPNYHVFYLFQGTALGLLAIAYYFFLGKFTEMSGKTKLVASTFVALTPGTLASAWVGSLEIMGILFIITGLIFHKKLLERNKLNRDSVIISSVTVFTVLLASITGETPQAFSFIILFSYSLYLLKFEEVKKFQWIPIILSFLIIFTTTAILLSSIPRSISNLNPVLLIERSPEQIFKLLQLHPPQIFFSVGIGGILIMTTYSLMLLIKDRYRKLIPITMLFIIAILLVTNPIYVVSASLTNEIIFTQTYSIPILSLLLIFSLSVIILKSKPINKFFSFAVLFSMGTLIFMAIYLNPTAGLGVGPRHYALITPFLIFVVVNSFKEVYEKVKEFNKPLKISLTVILLFSVFLIVYYSAASLTTFSKKTSTYSLINREVKWRLAEEELVNSSLFLSLSLPSTMRDHKTNFAYVTGEDIDKIPKPRRWEDFSCENLRDRIYLYRIVPIIQSGESYFRIKGENLQETPGSSKLVYNKTLKYTYIHPWIINYPKMILEDEPVISTHSHLGEIYLLDKNKVC